MGAKSWFAVLEFKNCREFFTFCDTHSLARQLKSWCGYTFPHRRWTNELTRAALHESHETQTVSHWENNVVIIIIIVVIVVAAASSARSKWKSLQKEEDSSSSSPETHSTTAAHRIHRNFLIICDRDNQSLANQSRKRHEHDLHQYTNGNHHQSSVARDQTLHIHSMLLVTYNVRSCGVFFPFFRCQKSFPTLVRHSWLALTPHLCQRD